MNLHITVHLSTPDTLRVAFAYNADVVATMKTIDGAVFDKRDKSWALPVAKLDRLIAKLGDDLAIDPEVFMAANPKTPAMVRAENERWMQTQGRTMPVPLPVAGPMGEVTKVDKMLHDGLPRWAAQEQKDKAMKEKGKKWTR